MKTREEQVEEMAKHLCSSFNSEYCNNDCPDVCVCSVHFHCWELQYAGYRKESDTVREFVERLKKKEHCCQEGNIVYWVIDVDDIAEVATEYGVEVE